VNPEKVLVDTSAWIVSFRKTGDPQLRDFLRQAIIAGMAVTGPIILLELLQGCKSIEERDALRMKLESLDLLLFSPSTWEQAYELGFALRRKGMTIPTTDILIAALAMENRTLLVHQDGHFEKIASVFPELRTKYFKTK